MKADLHVHSTASDGTLAPRDLIALALERGLTVLAIADHDSVEGLDDAFDAAQGTDLNLIEAVELSAVAGGRDVHILGYFVDRTSVDLRAQLADLRAARMRRASRMVEALSADGYDVELQDVLDLTGGGAVGRSHVARALVANGHASSVRDAFENLIGHGRPYYVSKDARTPAEAIDVIRQAGGIAVLAHPGINHADDLIVPLIDAGLGGLEAYHADHTQAQRDHYASEARRFGLLATGGTDFHGLNAPNPLPGMIHIPQEAVDALLAWGDAHR